jgi:hypothetical protein
MSSSLGADVAIEKHKDDEYLWNVGVDAFHR